MSTSWTTWVRYLDMDQCCLVNSCTVRSQGTYMFLIFVGSMWSQLDPKWSQNVRKYAQMDPYGSTWAMAPFGTRGTMGPFVDSDSRLFHSS